MDKQKVVADAIALIRIQDDAGSPDETRGQVVTRLTGIDISQDAFVAALRLVVEADNPGILTIPGVYHAVMDGFAFGVALAAHHQKSKNQESANGS